MLQLFLLGTEADHAVFFFTQGAFGRSTLRVDIRDRTLCFAKRLFGSSEFAASIGSATRTDSGFRIGQQVSHAKFGHGVIINADGSGKNVQVEVNFAEHGIKRLALEYAKLTAI